MPSFTFTTKKFAVIDGNEATITHFIEKQTDLAVLFAIKHTSGPSGSNERIVRYWFPKSQIQIDDEKPIGEIRLDSIKRIVIPDWLWSKKEAV